jgi:beta-galactosidase
MCAQNRFIKKKSDSSVQETIDKLEAILREKGIAVFAKINHFQNAKDVDLEMNESQVLLFGNPKIGTLMMQKNIFLSLDLPLKIAVVQDDSNNVWVLYTRTNVFRERYNYSESEIIERIDTLLNNVTNSIIT